MAFIYKIVLRKENRKFVLVQNRANSADSLIGVEDAHGWTETIGEVKHKTAVLTWREKSKEFKPDTISKLEEIVNRLFTPVVKAKTS